MLPVGMCDKLTERCDIHKHEVASLWDDGRHTGLLHDGGQTVSLALQLCSQRGEVALWLPHQLVVPEKSLCHGLLRDMQDNSD